MPQKLKSPVTKGHSDKNSAHKKRNRSKPSETAVFKKVSSLVNRSAKLDTILAVALEELLVLLEMDAGMFRVHAAPAEMSSKSVYRGFKKGVIAVFEACGDEDLDLPRDSSKWGSSALANALRKDKVQSFTLYPLRSEKRILGILGLACRKSKSINKAQAESLSAFLESIGIAITITQLREQSNKLSEDLIALQEVNKIISRGFNLEEIIQRIVIEGKRLAKTHQCHLFLLDDQRQCLVGSASTQTDSLDIRTVSIKISEVSLAITSLLERRVIAIDNIASDERSNQDQPLAGIRRRRLAPEMR